MSKQLDIRNLQKLNTKVKISDYKDRTDPKYVGPGTWDLLTRLAKNAITHELELEFEREMTEACIHYPCGNCAEHCKAYIEKNPIRDYYGYYIIINEQKVMIGMFVWIWKFHNAVNARLNKPIMDWDTAYNIYYPSDSLYCSSACMEAEHEINTGPVMTGSGSKKLQNVAIVNVAVAPKKITTFKMIQTTKKSKSR